MKHEGLKFFWYLKNRTGEFFVTGREHPLCFLLFFLPPPKTKNSHHSFHPQKPWFNFGIVFHFVKRLLCKSNPMTVVCNLLGFVVHHIGPCNGCVAYGKPHDLPF